MPNNKVKLKISNGVEISVTMEKIISHMSQNQLDLFAKMIQDEPERRKRTEEIRLAEMNNFGSFYERLP